MGNDRKSAITLETTVTVSWDDLAEEFHVAGASAQAEFLNALAVQSSAFRLLGIGGWERTLDVLKEDHGSGSVRALKELLEELLEGLEK